MLKSFFLLYFLSLFKFWIVMSLLFWKYFCKYKLMIVCWILYFFIDIFLGWYFLNSCFMVICLRLGIFWNVFMRWVIFLMIWKGLFWKLMLFFLIWMYILLGLVWIIFCVVLWSRICFDVLLLSLKKCMDEFVIFRMGWFEIWVIKLCLKRVKVMVI